MRICIDIDGVLFPWDLVAREALDDFFDLALPPSSYWNAIRDSVPGAAWTWLWSAEGQAHVFGQKERHYESAVLMVRALLAAKHEVHFVTHRDPRLTLVQTASFLDFQFGRCGRWAGAHSIRSTTPKHALGPWDVMIDDKPETVLDMAARETAVVFAPIRTWNRDELEGADGPFLRVYEDPADVLTWIREQG